jgi:hypothetical protein
MLAFKAASLTVRVVASLAIDVNIVTSADSRAVFVVNTNW